MPDSCCVYKCHNKGGQTDESGQKIRFYAIPAVLDRDDERDTTQARRDAWIAAIRRNQEDGKKWVPSKSSRVCSVHFHTGRIKEA